jgi:hypothetical protein
MSDKVTYNFEPQPDITTYELALCVKILGVPGIGAVIAYAAAPESVRRHFRRKGHE